jgi:hypothetical protein
VASAARIEHDLPVSWDLYLVPPQRGKDIGDWLEQAADEEGDEGEALRHAEAVRARRPELVLGGPYDGTYQLTLPEDSELPLDIELYGNHASVSIAYWDLGEREAELAGIVGDVVEALNEATGWVPYDPQEDRVIRIDEVRSLFGAGHAHGVGIVKEITASPDKPKRKRRFGLF